MKQSTHIATAIATNLALFKPTDLKSLVLLSTASIIGGVISDIDVTTSESHKELEKIIIVSFIAIVLSSICEGYFNLGIYDWLQNNISIAKNLGLILIFFCICFWGMHQPHRSFMHSIPCTALLTAIVFFIYPNISIYFVTAMLSHIILDIFNKRKVQIFYPLKFKFCLNICESNGDLDKALGKIASIICIIELIMLASSVY